MKNPDGPGWTAATFGEVDLEHRKWIDNRGAESGGYWRDQAWVVYREGDRNGTSGLHPFDESRAEYG